MSNILLAGVVSNPPTRHNSHNAGWTLVLRSYIEHFLGATHVDIATNKSDWNQYDEIYLTEGVNFRDGSWNLFGGVSQQLVDRLTLFQEHASKCTYIDCIDQTPNYRELAMNRCDMSIGKQFLEIQNVGQAGDYFADHHIIGDSHSVSVYEPGATINRIDGKTLHGALKIGLQNLVPQFKQLNRLTVYFGNIDIRFHICRQDNPWQAIEILVKEYEWQLMDMKLANPDMQVEVVGVLPIESPDRKIPKSGLYKDQPFFGEPTRRIVASAALNTKLAEMCDSNGFSFLDWDHLKLKGEYLDQSQMEARQSVHLAPTSYRHYRKLR